MAIYPKNIFGSLKRPTIKKCEDCLYFRPGSMYDCSLSEVYNIANAPCSFGNAYSCQSYTPVASNIPPMDKATEDAIRSCCCSNSSESKEEDYTNCEKCSNYLGDGRCQSIKEDGLSVELEIIDIDTEVKGKCNRYNTKNKGFSPVIETDFKDFCEGCVHMDCEVTKSTSTVISDDKRYCKDSTMLYIHCKHLNACENLYRRFKK